MRSPAGDWTGGFWVGLLWLAAQRTGEVRYRAAARDWAQRLRHRELGIGGCASLEMRREVHGRPLPVRKRALEQRVVFFVRGTRAEFDVDEQRPRCRGFQHLQQTRVMPPRPRPLAERGETVGVDADDDDVAVAFAIQHGRARVGDRVVERREAAARVQEIRAGKDGQHRGRPSELG